MLEIHEGALAPESLLELLPADDLAWAFEQHGEHLERLPRKLHLQPLPAQFTCVKVHLEDPEAYPLQVAGLRLHRRFGTTICRQLYHPIYPLTMFPPWDICQEHAGLTGLTWGWNFHRKGTLHPL